jgi:phage/plasmid-associated DNA primase
VNQEHHLKLRQSALNDQQIDALGWRTGSNGRLQIPYLRPDGTLERCLDGTPFVRERRCIAEIKADPKGPKYLSPKDNGCRIYHSALAIAAGDYEQRLNDCFTPLRITEGELKTESAAAHDRSRITIGLGGVNSWRDHRLDGDRSQPLLEFAEIPLQDREVRLCFDSDFCKPQVAAALRGLAEWLASRGAQVLIEVLPNDINGERLGLDDLIYRYGPDVFNRIASIARTPFKTKRQDGNDLPIWDFKPEPLDTRERNTYLSGLLGRYWRRSPDGKDRWEHWCGSHWVEVVGDDELSAAIESFADLQAWKNRELATFRSLQAAFRRTIQSSSECGISGLIPFRNGCLFLSDNTLHPHRPENGNTWCLPYDFHPMATCDRVIAFLSDRLGDEASVDVFRAFGRSLLTGERFKVFLEIVGPANSGKSVLTNLLIALVGIKNHTAGKLHLLEDSNQRFETLKLKAKRLAVFNECQDYSGQLQNLKAITGGDSIAAEIKGGRHIVFTFSGGVVLAGNGPIRASDPTGAVINRRRSLYVGKVVATKDECKLLEHDGANGWAGEFEDELPGFLNWVLSMPAAEARKALARDVHSLSRMEAELTTLLETDYLADWAERTLVWDASINADAVSAGSDQRLTIGTERGNPERHLYASYLQFIDGQGRQIKPLSLRVFKAKLVDLLRDTLGLPLPSGNPSSSAAYRSRDRGSLVPCLRFRRFSDPQDAPGVIRYGFQSRIGITSTGIDCGWIPDGKKPVEDSRDGCNGTLDVHPIQPEHSSAPALVFSIDRTTPENLSAPIPTVPGEGSQNPVSIPGAAPFHRDRFQGSIQAQALATSGYPAPRPADVTSHRQDQHPKARPIRVDSEPGWGLPGALPKSPTANVLVIDPSGNSRCVERHRISAAA